MGGNYRPDSYKSEQTVSVNLINEAIFVKAKVSYCMFLGKRPAII